MPIPTLEKRVAALETEVERRKHQHEPDRLGNALRRWQRFVGVFEADPEFEEAVRLGREWREARREPEDEAAT